MHTVSTLLELPETTYFNLRKFVESTPGADMDNFVTQAIEQALYQKTEEHLRYLRTELDKFLASKK